ncbi:MAG TPA: class I tRNA ligase family protein, partial [Armatimonadota bacterium]|nr:class I tRNA ligase family protein [Armatimonadota bacterium]
MAGKGRRVGSYAWSINVPRTAFPPRASARAERETLRHWAEIDLYGQAAGGDRPLFFLHDGPPFCDGGLHLGRALNRLLKDFVLKYKGMRGYATPFIPGWDMHGLPPEIAVIRKLGPGAAARSARAVRRRCAARARVWPMAASAQAC